MKKKSADMQGISAEHMQHASSIVSKPIANLFNKCKTENHIPEHLKLGKKIAIPKKGKDASDPNNSRGIVITSQLSKAYEGTIKQKENIPRKQHPLQFGFTRDLSPQMATLGVTEVMATAKAEKMPLYIVALDAQKAFDVVSHEILIRKLLTNGTPRDIIAEIISLYSNTSEVVLWEGCTSKPYAVSQGVRQGGIISADLYKLYVDELLYRLQETGKGMIIGSVHIAVAACADDIILMSPTKEGIQSLLDVAVSYSRECRYKLHPTKSVISAYRDMPPDDVTLYTDPIPTSAKVEHLGVTRNMVNPNTMKDCIEDRIGLMRRTSHSLMDIGLHGDNGMNPIAAMKIVNTYILPRLLFGLEAVTLTKDNINEMDKAHRNLIRSVQSLPRNTATEAIYLMSGCLPLLAEINIKRLSLLGAVARLPFENPLRTIALSQLALRHPTSHSWFAQTFYLAESYGIDIENHFAHPAEKDKWKAEIHDKVKQKHQAEILTGACSKSSLRMMDLESVELTPQPHPIWQNCGYDQTSIHKAAYRAKMLSGGYLLQATLAKKSTIDRDPTCKLCKEGHEDIRHFIWTCPALQHVREDDIPKIKETLQKLELDQPKSHDDWTKCILNGYPRVESPGPVSSREFVFGAAKLGRNSSSRRINSRNRISSAFKLELLTKLNKTCNRLCTKLHERRIELLKLAATPGASVKGGN